MKKLVLSILCISWCISNAQVRVELEFGKLGYQDLPRDFGTVVTQRANTVRDDYRFDQKYSFDFEPLRYGEQRYNNQFSASLFLPLRNSPDLFFSVSYLNLERENRGIVENNIPSALQWIKLFGNSRIGPAQDKNEIGGLSKQFYRGTDELSGYSGTIALQSSAGVIDFTFGFEYDIIYYETATSLRMHIVMDADAITLWSNWIKLNQTTETTTKTFGPVVGVSVPVADFADFGLTLSAQFGLGYSTRGYYSVFTDLDDAMLIQRIYDAYFKVTYDGTLVYRDYDALWTTKYGLAAELSYSIGTLKPKVTLFISHRQGIGLGSTFNEPWDNRTGQFWKNNAANVTIAGLILGLEINL